MQDEGEVVNEETIDRRIREAVNELGGKGRGKKALVKVEKVPSAPPTKYICGLTTAGKEVLAEYQQSQGGNRIELLRKVESLEGKEKSRKNKELLYTVILLIIISASIISLSLTKEFWDNAKKEGGISINENNVSLIWTTSNVSNPRHTLDVTSLTFTPDGQILVSSSKDSTIMLWNVTDGSLIGTILGHNESVNDIAISPNGQILVSCSSDCTLKIWNITDFSLILTLSGHTNYVNSVSISPNGQTIASGSADSTIKLWEVTDGSLLQTIEGYNETVLSITYSPDGRLLAGGYGDGLIKLWTDGPKKRCQVLSGHGSRVASLAFNPDNQLLASSSSDKTIKVWNISKTNRGIAANLLLYTLTNHSTYINHVAFSPNGQVLASGANDRTIKLWNVTDGSLLKTLSKHTDNVLGVTFSPNGLILASCSSDSTIKLWNVSNSMINSSNLNLDKSTLSKASSGWTGSIIFAILIMTLEQMKKRN